MSVKLYDQESHEHCHKNLVRKEHEHKKEKEILEQQLEHITKELHELKDLEDHRKHLNESIMITFKQTEEEREEQASRSIKLLKERHEEEIKRIKSMHYKEIKNLEENVFDYKRKCEEGEIEIERKGIEYQKRMLEMKSKFESEKMKELEEKENEIEELKEKLRKSDELGVLYKEFIEKRRENYEEDSYIYLKSRDMGRESYLQNSRIPNYQCENENMERITRKSRIKDIQESNIEDRRRLSASKESVKHVTAKIDKVLTQLKVSNNSKLHMKINEKLSKRLL